MSKVFIASSVFFAFIDRAHSRHDQAAAFFRYFGQNEYKLYTDILSITTTYNQLYKDISPSLGKDFLRTMYLGDINILYPEESDTKMALKALINYRSSDLTYPDALLAVLAYRRNISGICTFGYLPQLFGLTMFYLPV